MDKKTPGFYVRVDQRCYADDRLLGVSKAARWGWVALTAWSKDLGKDGRITAMALRSCDVSDAERAELVAAGLLDAGDGPDGVLSGWSDWQQTTAEIEATRQQKSNAGKKGAAVKHGHTPDATVSTPVEGALIDPDDIGELGALALAERIAAVWPRATGKFKDESAKKIGEALQGRIASSIQWPAVVNWLNDALTGYYVTRATEPKARDYLASPGRQIEKFVEVYGRAAA
jgi:hypothetical protein